VDTCLNEAPAFTKDLGATKPDGPCKGTLAVSMIRAMYWILLHQKDTGCLSTYLAVLSLTPHSHRFNVIIPISSISKDTPKQPKAPLSLIDAKGNLR